MKKQQIGMVRYKTTKADFAKFKKFCEEALDAYRLRDWDVSYAHKLLDEHMAQNRMVVSDQKSTIILSTDWECEPDDEFDKDNIVNDESLRDTAWHEVEHLLFMPFISLLEELGVSSKTLSRIEHQILAKLENARQ